VRFQRSLYDKQTGATHPMDNKIATLEFTYKPNLEMDDQNRIENPLGFWVTDYRVDNDYASSAPGEVMGAALNSNSASVEAPAPEASTLSPPDPAMQPPGQALQQAGTEGATSAAPARMPTSTSKGSANGVGNR
jgi:type IV secretion system protein VirB8